MDNHPIFFLIYNLSNRSPLLDNLMIFGARGVILICLLLFLILAFRGSIQEKKAFLLAILSYPVAFLLINIIHIFFIEERPFVTLNLTPLYHFNPDPSFPSVHTTIMAVMAFSYLYFKSRWSAFFLIMTSWVGISRIYVGVHYPLDIVGGILTAILSLIISKQIIRFLKLMFSIS